MFHRNPTDAFSEAIACSVLSDAPGEANYAGQFMYMYSGRDDDGERVDAFKHSVTRRYVFSTE